jgi:nitrous oxide reductase accessory protein NosL
MTKKVVIFLAALCLVVGAAFAMEHEMPKQWKNGQPVLHCKHCGMKLEMFPQSRMVVTYDDDSHVFVCSLHCMAVELAVTLEKTPAGIDAADYNAFDRIDAESAHWVVGGNLPGVMTRRAKWAFKDMDAAKAFIGQNGGVYATFDEAMAAAYNDMYSDTKMIREKRKMRMK